uniref:Uncharacterized protein n=1 Tax=Anguilla anguilla TaxID=7936 RepID=A0A0E9RIY7_ANGAN
MSQKNEVRLMYVSCSYGLNMGRKQQ